jgi:hypothetical protein
MMKTRRDAVRYGILRKEGSQFSGAPEPGIPDSEVSAERAMMVSDVLVIVAFGGISLFGLVLAWASWDEWRRKTLSQ